MGAVPALHETHAPSAADRNAWRARGVALNALADELDPDGATTRHLAWLARHHLNQKGKP
jgi:hypothetical protein